jgi:hypothetical protein
MTGKIPFRNGSAGVPAGPASLGYVVESALVSFVGSRIHTSEQELQ